MRFLLIDRISDLVPGESIKGVKCWSLSDEIFLDHFPGFPIVPGVLLTESMAQLSGFLIQKTVAAQSADGLKEVFSILSIVHKAKFRSFVVPGDKTELTARLVSLDENRATTSVSLSADGALMATADLSFILIDKQTLPENHFSARRKEYEHIIDFNREEFLKLQNV